LRCLDRLARVSQRHPSKRWRLGKCVRQLLRRPFQVEARHRLTLSLRIRRRLRLRTGKAKLRLPRAVSLDNIPMPFSDTLRVKSSAANDLSGPRERSHPYAVRFPGRPRAWSLPTGERLCRERQRVPRAGIGWSSNPPPVTMMVPNPAAFIAVRPPARQRWHRSRRLHKVAGL
jgi:hypothetical protein